MFPLGMVVGGVLMGMVLLMLWFLLRTSPSWLFLSQQAQQHIWRGDHVSTFDEQSERRGSEYGMKPPESLKW
jgi:hypothetical protein